MGKELTGEVTLINEDYFVLLNSKILGYIVDFDIAIFPIKLLCYMVSNKIF